VQDRAEDTGIAGMVRFDHPTNCGAMHMKSV
jgi:hypothetical protein